ncbi:MAG: FtsX-like permease family protein [Caldilineaceae bacterium]
MLSPRWKKVLRDITGSRARTALVIASIVVGIFAVGVVQHIRTVVIGEMQTAYAESNTAHATIYAAGITDALLDVIRRLPNVAAVQGAKGASVNVEVAPGTWQPLSINAVPPQDELRINKVLPIYQLDGPDQRNVAASHWPGNDEVLIERSALNALDALPPGLAVGDQLTLERADGKLRTVTVSGFGYDANVPPSSFTGSATAYVNQDTFERLGGATTYSSVAIRVQGSAAQIEDIEYVRGIADAVADKIDKSSITVQRVQVFRPGRLPLQDLFDAISLILTPLGVLALILGSFLVINTMSALMSQQTRQIGVMKAVGAKRGQVTRMYLGAVVIYSLLALAIAIPATVFLATTLERFLGGFINLTTPGYVLPTSVLIIQVSIGLFVPLLAALWPVIRGRRLRCARAISDYGVGKGQYGTSRLDRLLAMLQGISQPVKISLRNTFRRRARLILTLITLVMGGMIFMTVGSVRSSLQGRVEEVLAYNKFDITVVFGRVYRSSKLEQEIRAIPGIDKLEMWSSGSAIRVRPDGTESDPISITALPADSTMVGPTMISGRWLMPRDQNAIVLSQNILTDEPDIVLGDRITLKINEKERLWTVVGFAQTTEFGGSVSAYVTDDYFARMTNRVGEAGRVLITLQPNAPHTIDETAELLESHLESVGLDVARVQTVARIRAFTGNFFDIIVSLLLVMGVLIASVGALGLAGTMSTNVLERTREIGVMRAIGATDNAVLRIVMVEGVLIGLLSWLVGAALAFPAGYAMSNAVGLALFQTPLTYIFSGNGVTQWLIIVLFLAIVASYLPARNASRLTVREVLAYE